ncbi:hypothetical protein [Flavobacterium sp. M31R6]|uniref:hypothetical protein n=1 Tax=Flavobacterium sp. M31R6 TaxID=2739062 RepID=UPI001569A9BD|nr:hypothetical protein [Flavobacterium sp. M31R6]QKJ65074.1 hypothetical protein HQN62_18730 [Flavobacterium sp. M31R6]
MEKNIKITLLFIVAIITSSCEKKATEMDFEKSVMTEIFPSLVDSICVDSRKMLPPKFGENVYDQSGHFVREDSTKATKEQIIKYREWQKENEKVEKDTSSVIIAFDPFLKKNKTEQIRILKSYYPNVEFSQEQEEVDEYRFDFEKIKLNNKFKLKNISEFPKVGNKRMLLFEIKYPFVFSGNLFFSRIQFDKQKKVGVLEGGFDFCGRCGSFYIFYIKKVSNRWVIDKMILTSVS